MSKCDCNLHKNFEFMGYQVRPGKILLDHYYKCNICKNVLSGRMCDYCGCVKKKFWQGEKCICRDCDDKEMSECTTRGYCRECQECLEFELVGQLSKAPESPSKEAIWRCFNCDTLFTQYTIDYYTECQEKIEKPKEEKKCTRCNELKTDYSTTEFDGKIINIVCRDCEVALNGSQDFCVDCGIALLPWLIGQRCDSCQAETFERCAEAINQAFGVTNVRNGALDSEQSAECNCGAPKGHVPGGILCRKQ